MRNIVIFLVVVVALVVAMILLTREKAAPPAAVAPAPVPTPVRVAAPVAPRQPDSYQVLRPTPVSTFVPVAPPGERVQAPGAAAARASESKRAVMEAAAREAGVKIISYSESGSSANVSVEWSSDIATQGADFIDALLKRGAIRDFESTGKPVRSIRNSRSYWRNGFSVKW